jgi:O-antigen/teichoic acid export membrane protein
MGKSMSEDKDKILSDKNSEELFRLVSISGSSKIIAQIIYFIAREILLFNWLDKASSNDYTVFNGYIELFAAFMLVTPYLLPKIYQDINKNEFKEVTKYAFLIFFINFLILDIIFLVIVMSGFSFNISDNSDYLIFFLLSICSFFLILFNIMESSFYGMKKGKIIGMINILISSVFSLMLILNKFFFGMSFMSIVIAYFFTYLCGFLAALYLYIKHSKSIIRDNSDSNMTNNTTNQDKKSLIKIILQFSYPLFFTSIFYFLNFKVGNIILEPLSQDKVIYYHISTSIVLYIIVLIGVPINDSILPFLSSSFKKKDMENIKQIYFQFLPIIVMLIFSLLVILYTICPLVLGILYPDYLNVEFISLFRLIIIGGVFYSLNQFFGRYPIAMGKTKITLINQIIGGIINIIFLISAVNQDLLSLAGYGFLVSSLVSFLIFLEKGQHF